MELYCEECKAHGYWEGKHDCPGWLKFLVSREKKETNKD